MRLLSRRSAQPQITICRAENKFSCEAQPLSGRALHARQFAPGFVRARPQPSRNVQPQRCAATISHVSEFVRARFQPCRNSQPKEAASAAEVRRCALVRPPRTRSLRSASANVNCEAVRSAPHSCCHRSHAPRSRYCFSAHISFARIFRNRNIRDAPIACYLLAPT